MKRLKKIEQWLVDNPFSSFGICLCVLLSVALALPYLRTTGDAPQPPQAQQHE